MISLALLWHQHQPLYKDPAHPTPEGSYREPWVRLHAVRDYYSMAALVAQHPGVHLTINLTPALLWQIEDYTERGATDQSLELTRTLVSSLDRDQRDELLSTFFDADWHHQIFPHPRYKELFDPPPDLDRPIVPRDVIWTFTNPVDRVASGNRLVVQTNCPGELTWWLGEEDARTETLSPVGGVMAGVRRYHSILGPFEDGSGAQYFQFHCTHRDCDGNGLCCREDEHVVRVEQ